MLSYHSNVQDAALRNVLSAVEALQTVVESRCYDFAEHTRKFLRDLFENERTRPQFLSICSLLAQEQYRFLKQQLWGEDPEKDLEHFPLPTEIADNDDLFPDFCELVKAAKVLFRKRLQEYWACPNLRELTLYHIGEVTEKFSMLVLIGVCRDLRLESESNAAVKLHSSNRAERVLDVLRQVPEFELILQQARL